MVNKFTRLALTVLSLLLASVGWGQDGLTFGQAQSLIPKPQAFGQWRLCGPFTGGIFDALSTFTSNGTTQLSKTDRISWTTPNFSVVDPMFLYGNAYWTSGAIPSPVGNAITIKPYIEVFGNSLPIYLPNPSLATLTSPAHSGVTYVVSAGATSATQTFTSTTGMVVGCTVHFNNSTLNEVVKSVTDATHAVFFQSFTTTTSDNACTITAYPGSSFTIPDGGFLWSQHYFGLQLAANTNYPFRTHVSVGANQVFANILPYSYVGSAKSSDFVTGGTPDGGDYSTTTLTVPGVGTSSSFYYLPLAVVGRVTSANPLPVIFNTGDSIAYGSGNQTPFAGIMGANFASAGYYCYTAGLGGVSTVNYARFCGIIHSLAQYSDIVTVCLGNNDINAGFSLSSTIIPAFLLTAQELSAAGQPVYFMIQTPRTTASDSYAYMTYTFTTTSANATVGATYSDGASHTFKVNSTITGATTLVCNCGSMSGVAASGTLNLQSGAGDSTITYTAYTKALSNQTPWATPTTFEQTRVQLNNYMRDSSANGFGTYLNANLNTLGKVGGFLDVPKGFEVNIDGSALATTATTYTFTCTSANATYAATYTDANGNVHTVGPTIAGGTTLVCTCPASTNVPTSGMLNLRSGAGDSTITYTSRTQSSANQQAYGTGGYWPVNGTASYYTTDGQHPNTPCNALAAPYITGANSPISFVVSPNVFANGAHPMAMAPRPGPLERPFLESAFRVLPSLVESINLSIGSKIWIDALGTPEMFTITAVTGTSVTGIITLSHAAGCLF